MRAKEILIAIGGVVIGLIAGFLIANSINRSEINALRSQVNRTGSNTTSGDGTTGESLSNDEIRAKIAEADRNPSDLSFQKNLGVSLYRYGAVKQDIEIIAESARLLERASMLAPEDIEIVASLGHARFDIGYVRKDNDSLRYARKAYERVLKSDPHRVDIRTDLAITYYLEEPPNDKKAVEELKRALESDPRNQKALEFIVQALARLGDSLDAVKYLGRLREAYPSNPSIPQLSSQIETSTTVKQQ